MTRSIDIITMGCSKNLIDSERLLHLFGEAGFRTYHNPEKTHGDIAVVNTCGFIGDAKEESIEMILSLGARKAEGTLNRLYVMGCLSERYRNELREEIPEIDGIYGKFDWTGLLSELTGRPAPQAGHERRLTTPPHYAFLKISEGCDRKCAYCAIPLITGKHISRPMEDILEEVSDLTKKGVKEFQVIAQELTSYGLDLYGRQALPELVDRMARIPGVEWIRLHYAYPTHFPDELLHVMRKHPNICRYLDIALQHVSTPVLERMRRRISQEETLTLIEKMRREVPGIAIRTTLMVGFPGETEEDFEALKTFVRTARFERMGAFAYSEEEGTYAAEHYADDVPEEIKARRLAELMAIQQDISAEINAAKTGQPLRVIIDRREGDYYIGRSEHDSPEVDCEILIPADTPLEIGTFCEVVVTRAEEFDLYARLTGDC
ncbi:MAG: 30S ribosomal protein S12 methylthiotransferase RimO [Prevotellaceae bacterium]|nr:30S ribosomal protein S12 methylthiotransferase RimO [Prevotellaceae bacterium]